MYVFRKAEKCCIIIMKICKNDRNLSLLAQNLKKQLFLSLVHIRYDTVWLFFVIFHNFTSFYSVDNVPGL